MVNSWDKSGYYLGITKSQVRRKASALARKERDANWYVSNNMPVPLFLQLEIRSLRVRLNGKELPTEFANVLDSSCLA